LVEVWVLRVLSLIFFIVAGSRMVGLCVGVSMIGVLRENQSVSSWPSPGEAGVRVLLSEAVKWTLEFPLEYRQS